MAESETFLLRMVGGPNPGTYTARSTDLPWPLPDTVPGGFGDDTGTYVKVRESQLTGPVPGVARGAEYEWRDELPTEWRCSSCFNEHDEFTPHDSELVAPTATP